MDVIRKRHMDVLERPHSDEPVYRVIVFNDIYQNDPLLNVFMVIKFLKLVKK